ncbi:MAG TPA: efflux RND transporter periplasmic adaptor subunit [Longimicrobiales bacterium]
MRTWERVSAGAYATATILALGLSACNKSKAEEQTTGPEVAAVEKRDLDVTAEASGLIEPIQTVEIKSKASGEVQAVHVETGQEVQRGALLVQVEPRDVRNALAQAEADLEVAQARVLTSGANRKRVQELRKSNVATEQELETATLDEANGRAALVKARTNLELAKERMNDVTIRAPMNGTVIEKAVEPGTIIASASGTFGGGTTLLKMADLSVVQVRALVDQTDIGKVEPGQSARVTVEAYPGRPFTGQVVKIEPQAVVEQNVTMFPVLIHLQNEERLLKPGMNTEVEIEISHRTDATVVPNDAVVAMRDANTAGEALGLSEDQMKTSMENLRSSMRSQFARTDAPNGQTPAGASAGAGAPRTTPGAATAAGNTRAAGAATPAVSAECTALRAKARTAGFETLSDADRTAMRACFAGARGQSSGSQASAQSRTGGATLANGRAFGGGRGGFGGGRRGSTRPGIVFVPGKSGPEPRMVTLGVNDWDYTEVLSGLKEGDKVFLMTAARLEQQQKDMQDRVRQRSNQMGGMRQNTSAGQTGQGNTQGRTGGR